MIYQKKYHLLHLPLFVFVFTILTPVAWAQNQETPLSTSEEEVRRQAQPTDVPAIGLQIQPISNEYAVDPGTTVNGVIRVTNSQGGLQTFFISPRNIEGMSETGSPIYGDAKTTDPERLATWIVPSLRSITIDENQSIEVPYTIIVPEGASPGGHYAGIFVTREADPQVSSGAGVGFHVSSLVILRVGGTVVDDLTVREFSTGKSFYTEPNVRFFVKVENSGTVYQRPQGKITLTDMLGNKVADVPFNEKANQGGGGMIHRSTRVFEDSVWQHDGFTLGRYTAELSVVYGEKGARKTITRSLTFWVVPVKELGIALGAIVASILFVVFGLRAYIRKELARAGHSTRKAPSQKVTFARMLVRNLLWIIGLLGVLFVGMLVFFG